ncbi:hypothetical protein EFV61_00670 [Yersinia enterocolitica]|nr:hypothetical protein [Yersinia enterocolitica]EKN4925173.1 hypothetical protein [Yersinia enterocolitica]EKN4929163.1 hypothetical protein [Yersinia enterocolitica]EKN5011585.1 hypothetical protein [Yersinia enterocolitica]EKN5025593.1 hypothetical protein [Yersinia enterocolitica]
MTNLPGADLNAVGSGLTEARPMDGPSNESSQYTCNLKDDGYKFIRSTRATIPYSVFFMCIARHTYRLCR